MVQNSPEKFKFIYSLGIKQPEGISFDKLPEGQTLNIQHLLEKAARAGSHDCVRLLIEKYGADPDRLLIPLGMQPLYLATANDKSEVVRYLLENHGSDIHLGSGRYAAGPIALWIGIVLKSLDSVAVLLEHGGPVDHIDEEILNVNGPISAILNVSYSDRPSVRFETESNATDYIEAARVEIGLEDKNWISKLQYRRPNEELREKGEGARELDKKEGARTKDLEETDVRRLMVDFPSVEARERELNGDDDLIPVWSPAFVAVRRDDSE